MIIPVLSAFDTRQRPSILVKSMQRKTTFITISASAGVMVNLCDVFHLNRCLLYSIAMCTVPANRDGNEQ